MNDEVTFRQLLDNELKREHESQNTDSLLSFADPALEEYIQSQVNKKEPPKDEEEDDLGLFKSFGLGVNQYVQESLPSRVGGIIAQHPEIFEAISSLSNVPTSTEEFRKFGENELVAAKKRGEQLAKEYPDEYYDEISWSNFYSPHIIGKTLGSQGPTLALTMAAATIGTVMGGPVGGIAAAGLVAYGMEAGDAYAEAREAGADSEAAKAAGVKVGLINAGLETFPVMKLLKRTGLSRILSRGVVKEAVKKNEGLFSLPKKMLFQAIEEAGTETIQELNTWYQTMKASGKKPDYEDLKQRLVEAGYAGALLGAGGAGIGTGVKKYLTREEEAKILAGEEIEHPVPEETQTHKETLEKEMQTAFPEEITKPESTQKTEPVKTPLEFEKVGESEGFGPKGEKYEFEEALVEMDDLVVSHDPDTFEENPEFPKDLQPRNRDRAKSKETVINTAKDLKPELVLEDMKALDRGTPVIGRDGIVESGNGRVMAIIRASTLHQDKWKNYQDALKAKYPGAEKMNAPVLVRMRKQDMDPSERKQFVKDANTPVTEGLSSAENAENDASRLGPDFWVKIDPVGNTFESTIKASANRESVRGFVESLPETERATILDKQGQITNDGIQRIKRAGLAGLFGLKNNQVTEKFVESDDFGRNIVNGVSMALPGLLKSKRLIESGAREAGLSFVDDLSSAISHIQVMREKGMTIKDYFNQGQIFEEIPEKVKSLGTILAERSGVHGSQKKISEFLNRMTSLIDRQPDPNNVSMFGDETSATLTDIIEEANKDATGDLFDQEPTTTPRSDGGEKPGETATTSPASGNKKFMTVSNPKGSIEVKFLHEPREEILSFLKDNGFRYDRKSKVWKSAYDPDMLAALNRISVTVQTEYENYLFGKENVQAKGEASEIDKMTKAQIVQELADKGITTTGITGKLTKNARKTDLIPLLEKARKEESEARIEESETNVEKKEALFVGFQDVSEDNKPIFDLPNGDKVIGEDAVRKAGFEVPEYEKQSVEEEITDESPPEKTVTIEEPVEKKTESQKVIDTVIEEKKADPKYQPKELLKYLMDNGNKAFLINGWRIIRSGKGNDARLQIQTSGEINDTELKDLGLETITVGFKKIYSTPKGKKAEGVLKKVIEKYPVVSTSYDPTIEKVPNITPSDIDEFINDSDDEISKDILDKFESDEIRRLMNDDGYLNLSVPANFLREYLFNKRIANHLRYWLFQGGKKDKGFTRISEERHGNVLAGLVQVNKGAKYGRKLYDALLNFQIGRELDADKYIRLSNPQIQSKIKDSLINGSDQKLATVVKDKTERKRLFGLVDEIRARVFSETESAVNKFVKNNNLADIMVEKEVVAQDLIERIDDDSITLDDLFLWIDGKDDPQPKQIVTLGEALGVDPKSLFTGIDKQWLADKLNVPVDNQFIDFIDGWVERRKNNSGVISKSPELSAETRKIIADTDNYTTRQYIIDFAGSKLEIDENVRNAMLSEIQNYLKEQVSLFIQKIPKWKKHRELFYQYIVANSAEQAKIREHVIGKMGSRELMDKMIYLDEHYKRINDFAGNLLKPSPDMLSNPSYFTAENASLDMEALVKTSENMLESYLKRDGNPGAAFSENGVPIHRLMHRFLQSQAFRTGYGEIYDPVTRMALTLKAQELLNSELYFLQRIFEEGQGSLWDNLRNDDAGISYQLPDNKKLYGRLAGKWVTKAVKDELDPTHGSQKTFTRMCWNGWTRMVQTARVGKLYMPVTIERNLLSSYYAMAVGCGDAGYKEYWTAYAKGTKLIRDWIQNKPEAIDKVAELVKAGVIDPWASSYAQGLQPSQKQIAAIESMAEKYVVKKGSANIWEWYDKNILANMWKGYATIDYPAKYAAYELHLELNRAQGMEDAAAKEQAAEWVRQYYQNNTRVMRLAKAMNNIGVQDFSPFQFDSARIRYNQARLAITEAKKGNLKPAIGFTFSAGFWAFSLTSVIKTASKIAAKMWNPEDEDDKFERLPTEKEAQAMRHFEPWYYRDSNLLSWYTKDGNLRRVILDYGNFYPFESAVISAIQQEKPERALVRLLSELGTPALTGEDYQEWVPGMVPTAVYELLQEYWKGKDPYGNIVTKGETVRDFFIETMNPASGMTNKLWRLYEQGQREKVGNRTGYQSSKEILDSMFNMFPVRTANPQAKVSRKLYDHDRRLTELRTQENRLTGQGFELIPSDKAKLAYVRSEIDREYDDLIHTVHLAKVAFPEFDKQGKLEDMIRYGINRIDREGEPIKSRRDPSPIFGKEKGKLIYDEKIDEIKNH